MNAEQPRWPIIGQTVRTIAHVTMIGSIVYAGWGALQVARSELQANAAQERYETSTNAPRPDPVDRANKAWTGIGQIANGALGVLVGYATFAIGSTSWRREDETQPQNKTP